MTDLEHRIMERVGKARARLILERRFYGVLVSNVDPLVSRRVPTAATNGKTHLWNPEYVEGLTDEELLGVQAHESEHDARHHGTRRGSRDPYRWNIAGDYSINGDLIAEGFTLPKGAYIDAKYTGMSTEDIYRSLELDEQRKQNQPQPEPEDADEESDEQDDGDDEADTQPGGQDDDTDDGDDEGDDGSDADDDESDAEGDDADADGGDADGEAESEGGGAGEGEGGEDAADADDGSSEGTGEGEGEGSGTGSGKGTGGGDVGEGDDEGQLGSGDPGGCGEVLDSEVGDGEAAVAEDDAKWDRVVRQAASMAKAVGQLPGHISRDIERANNPPRDWRDELREFAEQGMLRVETWNRPNRRFIGRGLVLPSTIKDGINKAVFMIDTSGSCDAIALACVQNEAQAMLDDGIIDHIVVVYGDTRVTRVDEYATGDDIEFDPRGGGGTDMEPLFSHVAEEHDDAR